MDKSPNDLVLKYCTQNSKKVAVYLKQENLKNTKNCKSRNDLVLKYSKLEKGASTENMKIMFFPKQR